VYTYVATVSPLPLLRRGWLCNSSISTIGKNGWYHNYSLKK